MSSGAPWSVKGIDPRARAVAKTAARKEGMTLGEWLNRVILDDGEDSGWDNALEDYPGFPGGEDDALKAMVDRLTSRLEAAERRSTLALSGVDQSVLALTRRLEALEDSEDAADRDDAIARTRAQQDELLDRIRKLERARLGGGDPAALKALENTIGKLAGRLYETERDVRTELDTLAHKEERRRETGEAAHRTLTERLAETERRLTGEQRDLRERLQADAQRAADLRSGLEDQSRSLQRRIIAAESATHRAAEALVQSQEKLEERLRTLEAGDAVGAEDINRRFDLLGRELASLIRETREDCARRVSEVAASGVDGQRLERALEAAEARLSRAESRQTDALTRIGEEVSRLARAVDRRIEEAERRLEQKLTESADRQDGHRSRADLDSRLERVREENTAAVRRIGEQVARLGENLTDRVQQAELRSAKAVEQAGERMAQVVEKLETQRETGKVEDLETRIQASEERTVHRIEEAMKSVHERLDQARTETADALSPVQRAMTALADRLEAIEASKIESQSAPDADAPAANAAEAETAAPAEPDIDLNTPLPQPPGLSTPVSEWDEPPAQDEFVMEAESAAPEDEPDLDFQTPPASDAFGDETKAEPRPEAPPKRGAALGATADASFLAAARKTVRSNGGASAAQWSDPETQTHTGGGRSLLIGASVLGFGAMAAAAVMLALEAFGGDPEPASRVAQSATPETLSALFAEPAPSSGAGSAEPSPSPGADEAEPAPQTDEPAAAATQSAAPATEPDAAPAREAAVEAAVEAAPPAQAAPRQTPETAPAPAVDPDAAFMAAVTVTPTTLDEAAASGDPVARYQLGLQRLQQGQFADAAALMRRAAEQGVPEAMRIYGLMLTRGEGVAQDAEAGRDFVVRAAEAGNIQAMHDAGGLFINAPETPETQAAAARWFQEAALHGLSDSQFNIALLFQEGFGVPQSAADAYAWFLIAANGGDTDAGDRAARLRPDLDPTARAEAERVASTFTPRDADPAAQGRYAAQAWSASPAQLTARAQTLLSELGYNAGPADGVLGERTRRAIVRYQRDAGLEPGAPLNASLVARLEQSAAN